MFRPIPPHVEPVWCFSHGWAGVTCLEGRRQRWSVLSVLRVMGTSPRMLHTVAVALSSGRLGWSPPAWSPHALPHRPLRGRVQAACSRWEAAPSTSWRGSADIQGLAFACKGVPPLRHHLLAWVWWIFVFSSGPHPSLVSHLHPAVSTTPASAPSPSGWLLGPGRAPIHLVFEHFLT